MKLQFDPNQGYQTQARDSIVDILIDLGYERYHRSLVLGMGKLGYKPTDIKRVIFTHLHFDHLGKPDAFKNAEFFASEVLSSEAFGLCFSRTALRLAAFSALSRSIRASRMSLRCLDASAKFFSRPIWANCPLPYRK